MNRSGKFDFDLTVIIPVYNRLHCFLDGVESVVSQNVNCKIIVVDDGSEVTLEKMLLPYGDRVFLIRHSHNKGVSAARNTGVFAAKTKYVSFLDSDDLYLRQKVSNTVNFMEEKGYRVCHTNEYWYKTDRFINQGKKHVRYGGDIFTKVLDICRVSPSTLMVEKELFCALGGFDENLMVCEDYEFLLRLSLKFSVGYLDEKLIIKRSITDNSLSASIKHIESIRLAILKRFAQNNKLTGENLSAFNMELRRKEGIVKLAGMVDTS